MKDLVRPFNALLQRSVHSYSGSLVCCKHAQMRTRRSGGEARAGLCWGMRCLLWHRRPADPGGGVDEQWAPGVVRRLFDRELDNNHEEPLLAAQLAARQLRVLTERLTGPAQAALRAAMLPWLAATLQVSACCSLSRRHHAMAECMLGCCMVPER